MPRNSKKCPVCHNNNQVVHILYGLPTEEAFKGMKAGKIHLGGCMEETGAPMWYCKRCEKEFGKV